MADSISDTGRESREAGSSFHFSVEDFQRILDRAPFGFFQVTPRKIAAGNYALASMLGWSSVSEMLADTRFCADFLSQCGLEHDREGEAVACLGEPAELRRKDGSILQARLSLLPVYDARGTLCCHEAFVEDVSQEEALHHRLREMQGIAMRGQVAGGLAHDFNNILSATLIHLGLLLQDPTLSEVNKEGLKVMRAETERAADLTRQLLSFSRRNTAVALEPLELSKLISGMLKMLRRVARENILVVFLPTEEDCWINADAGLLEMLVMHICLLSRHALPRGGTLTLATSFIPLIEGGEGARICLSVKQSHADSAQNTRPPARRTALHETREEPALQAIKEIVALHHGRLEMPSRMDRDDACRIFFPAMQPPDRDVAASRDTSEVQGGSETILLVEDERYLRRMSTLCLRKLGYAVLEAGDDEEAMQIWEKHGKNIDLLFTDFLLPGASTGLQLARRMEQDKPGLKVMIASGQGIEFEDALAAAGGGIAHLSKPYTAGALAAALRECLDSPAVAPQQT
jgi:signal transduction histidine kinase/ActR/RegA family two-component response regulator